jgi:hypothetical protein
MKAKEKEIVDDILRVARDLGLVQGKDRFSRSDYLNRGARFSHYDLYDNGLTWEFYCEKAGFKAKTKEPVPDEVYFERLRKAVDTLGRLPKVYERKKFGLNFSKRRWPTLDEFVKYVISNDLIELPDAVKLKYTKISQNENAEAPPKEVLEIGSEETRLIPPIPVKTRRKKWERTGIVGFPYAPQDESGVIALFSILCSQGVIPWQIIDLNSGKGVDATCYDDKHHREYRVELKHILSQTGWNHSFDTFDYLVCWENRWKDFPKPVLELKTLIKK